MLPKDQYLKKIKQKVCESNLRKLCKKRKHTKLNGRDIFFLNTVKKSKCFSN